MRKRARRCPGVEGLDARTLLSGGAAATIQSLQLSGSLHGTTATRPNPIFQASGTLSPLGKVTAAGHGSIDTVTGPNGSFNLRTKQGSVFVGTDVRAIGKRSYAGDYAIQGGTGAYAGDRGSGSFAVTHSGYSFSATFS
jgi:hypothetical protein